jgi:hypothetical protein
LNLEFRYEPVAKTVLFETPLLLNSESIRN